MEVPSATRTFHVKLGSNAALSIRGKVFHRINRISIDGGAAGGRQQISFDPKAFHDNLAPFPEIDLKHAQKFNIHGNAFQGKKTQFRTNKQALGCLSIYVA